MSGWSPTWKFTTIPPVGITEPAFESTVSIYPNPADETVFIQMNNPASKSFQISITDVLGVKVYDNDLQLTSGNTILPVQVSELKNGIYMLRLVDGNNTFTTKIIIKR
jgi:hypothetical protein